MTYGLRTFAEDGRPQIDENTFTVRMVGEFFIESGSWSVTRRFTVPAARKGMFATGCALSGYRNVFEPQPYSAQGWYKTYGYGMTSSLPKMPAFRVGDGYVEAFAPSDGGVWTGNVQVLVFSKT